MLHCTIGSVVTASNFKVFAQLIQDFETNNKNFFMPNAVILKDEKLICFKRGQFQLTNWFSFDENNISIYFIFYHLLVRHILINFAEYKLYKMKHWPKNEIRINS